MRRFSVVVSVAVVCALMSLGAFAVPARGANASWTFAIYMCSDNDLDAYGDLNMEWLMSAEDSDEVNFVVLWDRSDGPAKLYKVSHNEMTELTDFSLNGEEVNMGDPDVLVAFVDYLNSEFRAEKVFLDLWDHGDDFRGICYDYDSGTSARYDLLTHQEIGDALSGKHVDVIGGDGCGISTIEVAYEYVMRGVTAQWFVANENYVPLDGFPYEWICSDLVEDPGISAEELAADMTVRYAEYYQGGWLTMLSAIDLTKVKGVVDELWDVTAILTKDMRLFRGMVASGRAVATMGWSQYGWEGTVDFPKIFEVVYSRAVGGSTLKVEAGELLAAIDEAIPYIGMSTPGYVWDFGGTAVFFPCAKGSFTHNTFWRGSIYQELHFAQDGWMAFLTAYFGR